MSSSGLALRTARAGSNIARLALVATAVIGALAIMPVASALDPDEGTFSGNASDDIVTIIGEQEGSTGVVPVGTGSSGAAYTYKRIPQTYCGTNDASPNGAMCVDGVDSGPRVTTCPDGSAALDPLFRREVNPATGQYVGPWVQVDAGGCLEDLAAAVVLTAEEFRRLPLSASPVQVQPADGRSLVNMDLVVFTEPAAQELQTTVLGMPVAVRATPVSWTWHFGDGSPALVTTDPGAAYPAYTLGHPYSQPGTYELTLVTTWAGQFSVNGTGPWQDVAGTAETTSAPFTVQVEEARSVLVAEPLP